MNNCQQILAFVTHTAVTASTDVLVRILRLCVIQQLHAFPSRVLLCLETSHGLLVLFSPCSQVQSHSLSSALQGCGFRLYNQLDGVPLRGMPACNLDMSFEPSMHVFCQDASASALKPFTSDGLPKYKDFPKQNGGSGDTLQL